jgi:hypothetical protein
MTWNYRIIEFSDYRALHEVHYDEKGRPWAYTSEPREFVQSLDEDDAGAIVADLEIALSDAQRLPVLPVSVFDLAAGERPILPRTASRTEAGTAETPKSGSARRARA